MRVTAAIPTTVLSRLSGFLATVPGSGAGDVYRSDVLLPVVRCGLASVRSLQEQALFGAEESAPVRDGLQEVLRADQRVLGAQALDLVLDELAVGRHDRSPKRPGILEVALLAAGPLGRQVVLPLLFEQRVVGPGRAVQHHDRIVSRRHRQELALKLLPINVLRLIHL